MGEMNKNEEHAVWVRFKNSNTTVKGTWITSEKRLKRDD
jgi:hypothetical protein